ncbi:hypothetical protein F8388_004470 [Cannabis sativa]|uniref:PPM-type phosphatase domain-containing protein n=1 Tax=Cannabis sativa TaxID=3483 RepID=A0A7J6E347_CANSA|nr:hypothetical protein F8388_003657 [Cannabis sativa]KAF4365193.1 hypothetical protein G4B88_000352 [Cannabis sativa]KAF4392141.1 hypothetical protein F8388_004470 [Cannabis sativa]
MCVKDLEQVEEETVGEDLDNSSSSSGDNNDKQKPLQHTQMENFNDESPVLSFIPNSLPLESISEDRVIVDKQNQFNFVPALRSGEWSDIGSRPYMEDTHVCISNLAEKYGFNLLNKEAISFYGLIISLAVLMLSRHKSLLVANAGDCRAVLSRCARAIELSRDHRPCCIKEKTRVESLGGFVDDGYLNGQLGVTRALGDWHLEGMKEMGDIGGPLSAEPELRLFTLTKDDEFLIIGSDGIWEVFSNQNAVDIARKKLQEHNDVKLCCKAIVEEAIKRGADDNLTVVMVSFHLDPPPQVVVERPRVRRSISAEGLNNLRSLLEGTLNL